MNLLEDVEGAMPHEKGKIMDPVVRFFNMPHDERESFIVGRRIGRFRHLSDYRQDPEIERLKRQLKNSFSSLDEAILEVLWNYI